VSSDVAYREVRVRRTQTCGIVDSSVCGREDG